MDTKKCSKCGEVKPVSEFYPHLNTFDSWCKDCRRAYWTFKYHTDPEFKERHHQYSENNRCVKMLRLHHELLKDDPERLTTDFLVEMTGCKCRRRQA